MNQITNTASFALLAGEAGFDPIEDRLRANVRATIEAVFEEELALFLGRLRCGRGDGLAKGYRHGHLHDELTEDYRDMICADTAAEIETRRKAFLRKWRLKCRAVADSLEEAGDRLFTFTRLDPSQWKSARTTNAIERLNGEVA